MEPLLSGLGGDVLGRLLEKSEEHVCREGRNGRAPYIFMEVLPIFIKLLLALISKRVEARVWLRHLALILRAEGLAGLL